MSGLTSEEKTLLILQVGKKDEIQRYVQEHSDLSDKERRICEIVLNYDFLEFSRDEYKKIKLPPGMTIGIEIESEGIYSKYIPRGVLNNRWKRTPENSLEDGVEIVSPILTGSDEDSKEIYEICDFLVDIGQTTSERCGGHVHIAADYLTSKEAYFNLLEIYGNCEEIIYAISNAANSNLRKGIKEFCKPVSQEWEKLIESGRLNAGAEKEEVIRQLQEVQGQIKYFGINFKNIGTSKNTIEFRMPNGTLDPDTWIENVNLFGGIIKAAQELAIIQSKAPHEITEEDKEKLGLLNKIKSPNIDENERLEALLSLTVEDKEVYRERYSKNIELMHADEEISETMKKARATQPIDIRKIGATVLTGSNPVRGEEVEGVEQVFDHDIQQCIEGEKTNE